MIIADIYNFFGLATKVLLLFNLVLLPGSWITLGLPIDNLNLKTRLALGVALSPGMLAVQYFVLRSLGVSFSVTAVSILIINSPVLFFLGRNIKLARLPQPSKSIVYGSLLFMMLVGITALPWILIPNYRAFNWHALLHTDIVYELSRSVHLLPEEPELAGLTLSYTWTGEVFWSVLGWLSNWSPTSIYPISNLIWLLAACILAYELAKDGLKLHDSTALLSAGLLFTGPGIIVTLAFFLLKNTDRLDWILGLMTEFISKYRGFEVILFGNAAVLGIALLSVLALQRKIKSVGIVLSCLLITLGLVYPILFPAGCLLVGGLIFLLITKLANGLPRYTRKEIISLIVSVGISIIVFLVFMMLTTQDRSESVFQILQTGRKAKTVHVFIVFLPFFLASAPYLVKSIRNRSGPPILLFFSALCLMALYNLTSVYELEYKFILMAAIALAPLASAGVEPFFSRFPKGRWVLALLVPFIFGGLNLIDRFQSYSQGGLSNLKNAPPIVEDSFLVALDSTDPNSGWSNTIRSSTPTNTIVIAQGSHIHLGPFLNRSLYFPSDIDGKSASGYSLDNQSYLIGQRGYSEDIWKKRYEDVQILFNSSDTAELFGVLQDLLSFDRPLAILFSEDSTPALTWFENEMIGSLLYGDENFIVWYINMPISTIND